MKTLTVVALGVVLLGLFFQCCPSTAPEVRQPGEEPAAPPPVAEPTMPPMGLSPENPVPLGHTVVASDGAAITVHGITARAEEAARMAKEWNMFNEPDAGNEYIMVAASVTYEGGYSETLNISEYDFKAAVGTRIFDHAFVIGEGNEMDGEMLEGGRIDGVLVFEVPHGATGILVIYEQLFGDNYYLATE